MFTVVTNDKLPFHSDLLVLRFLLFWYFCPAKLLFAKMVLSADIISEFGKEKSVRIALVINLYLYV